MTSNIDYKDTLNLPKTAFPMKASLPIREPDFLEQWQKDDIYQKIRAWAKGREKFILHDGPPYANGNIHIGHASNKILKDIIIKSKTLSGYDCPYVPGWDCHGLPIEREIEKKKGRAGNKVSHQEFRALCRDFAGKQVEKQKEDFKRLGVFGEWDNPYLTMDFTYEANIIRALKEIYEKGHLVKGYKPVHWCTDCHSSLAEAEVEYADKTSPSIDVKFTATDLDAFLAKFLISPESLGQGEISVLIWTTTPWTLPANEAVALGKDLDYSLVQVEFNNIPERWLVASELLEPLTSKYEQELKVLAEIKGEELEYLKLQHPLEDREVPIVLGDHVTLDGGTGCVHTAPGHGPDDYLLGVKYGLPVDHEVLASGVFSEKVNYVANLHVFKANPVIVDILKQANKLVCYSDIQHSYPHCWRHKTPIIFRATPQWFVSMSKQSLREKALETIKDVKWIPDWGYARMQKMVEQRPDWCISRQRTWCVPMPLFVNKNTKEMHPSTSEIMDYVAGQVEEAGVEAWYQLDKTELLKKFDNGDEATNHKVYETGNDTLDVWFDSGVTHYAVLKQHPDLQWPADLYLEGSDQHRGWFGSSLMTSVCMYGTAPYRQVLTHGFIVDKNGHKMSKSLGNVISPNDVNNKWGADILRLWVAGADYRGEIVISEEIFKRIADIYRRIRNTARFLLSNLNGFDPNTDLVGYKDLIKLDAWAVQRAVCLQQEIEADFSSYNFRSAYMRIHDFCSIDMGGFYLDIIKDRQYTTKEDSLARRSAQTAMYYIIKMLAKWIAPILSFTAEEIWQNIPKLNVELEADNQKGTNSIFLNLFNDNEIKGATKEFLTDNKAQQQEFSLEYWQKVIAIKTAVNKQLESLRAEGKIGSSLQAEVELFANDDYYTILTSLSDELRFILITSSAKILRLSEADNQQEMTDTELEGLKVSIKPSSNNKCIRCWHYCADVGSNLEHPELCGRCVTNIVSDGEERLYA